jgi:hypothetical protein
MPVIGPPKQFRQVDLMKTLQEGDLRERLAQFSGDRVNLDQMSREELMNIIVELQNNALTTLDPDFDPNNNNSSDFYDYWDDWNLNNWGNFLDHDFDNT